MQTEKNARTHRTEKEKTNNTFTYVNQLNKRDFIKLSQNEIDKQTANTRFTLTHIHTQPVTNQVDIDCITSVN